MFPAPQPPRAHPWRTAFAAAALAILCVVLLQPLFLGSLYFARQHTDLDPIRKHIVAAFDRGVLGEDEVPRQLIHRSGHQFTECAALHLSIDDEPNTLTTVLMPQLQGPYVGPCGELSKTARGIATAERTDYSRYWHGYRLWLWPMLERLDVDTMRFINAGIVIAALALFFVALRETLGPVPGLILFVVLMSLTDIWRIWRITPHWISMIVILAGSAGFAMMHRRWRSDYAAIVAAAALGAIFNFVDFLINPPMMPMFLSFFVLAIAAREPSERLSLAPLPLAALVALAWFGGYAFTWAAKWALALWFATDKGATWSDIAGQIALRLYGQEKDGPVRIIPLWPTVQMIAKSFVSGGVVFVAVIAAAVLTHVRNRWATFDTRLYLILMSPTLIPIVWFEVLNNHTQTHQNFTYRSEAAALAIMFAVLLIASGAPATLRELWNEMKAGFRRS